MTTQLIFPNWKMDNILSLLFLSFLLVQGLSAATSDEELLAWEAPADMIADCPYYLLNYEEKTPIWLIPFGIWKDKEHMKGKNRKVLSKYVDQGVARAIASGKNGTNFMMIVDLEGMKGGLFDPKLNFFVEKTNAVFKIINGKELEHFWLINADAFIHGVVSVFKATLSKDKQARIESFKKSDFEAAKESLGDMISDENLITKYGGNAEFKPEKIYG